MNQRHNLWIIPVLCLLLLVFAGCEREREQPEGEPPPATDQQQPVPEQQPPVTEQQQPGTEGEPLKAVAELQPTEGNQASGTITFESQGGEVRVIADLQGLQPGKHGFHVHEKGDCSAPDASSAGEHFNPAGTPHGAPTATHEQRHVGDLGNVEADADGKAHLEMADRIISLEGENSIVGKAVVVHAQEDDLQSQPTGNAGGRVACGVIESK